MPLFELNNRSASQIATGFLIREERKEPFRYSTVVGTRRISKFNLRNDSYQWMRPTVSIETNDNLNFVTGDEVEIEHFGKMSVANVEPVVEEAQSMFLVEQNVKYILDLE